MFRTNVELELRRQLLRAAAFMVVFLVLVGIVLLMGGCDSTTPTAPISQATPTPAPTATPAPIVATTPTPAPTGKHDWWFRADGSFCVTNHSGGTTRFEACARRVYPGGDQDFAQTDATVPGGWIPDGDTFCGTLPLFGCYTEMELLEQPNTCNDFKQIVGARYLNVGLYCQRTPPSPPPPTPSPSPSPCATAGTFSLQTVQSSSARITASVALAGSGDWVLTLYATSDRSEYDGNAPDYVKDIDATATVCGTAGRLAVSYDWLGHASRFWWADLKLNGQRVWKSAPVEH